MWLKQSMAQEVALPAQSMALPALYCNSALAGAALGLFNPLIAALMTEAGFTAVVVGATSTLFFLCVLLATPLAHYLGRRFGARGVLITGMVLTAAAVLPFPWQSNLALWCVLRALMGAGIGLYMIGGQSAVNALAEERRRAFTSGMYALAFGAGLGLGPLLGAQLYRLDPALAFAAGAALLLAAVPWLLKAVPSLRVAAVPPRLDLLMRLSLPLHGVFAYGIAEATLLTMYPVFLLQRGYSVTELSAAFSAFVIGGLVSTLPVTRLADRYGRERALRACALVGLLAILGLTIFRRIEWVTLSAVLAGASLGPVFALAMALVGSALRSEETSAGSTLFTATFSCGSMVAPLLTGALMQSFGAYHVFSLTLLLFASLLARLALRPQAVRLRAP